MAIVIGSIIAGKYRIQRQLGQGGMGTVYLARHLLLDRAVAIKILRDDVAANSLARARLVREGRALARLRGPHIARVLDVEAPEGGPCFLVLEYLDGEHLGSLLERSGPLPVSEAVDYIMQVCEALAEAHREGIIHRDIKPSNLLLTILEDGSRAIKVIDFGISKYEDSADSVTQSGAVVGSPSYMAPEQMWSGSTVDCRCDVWALGVVFYEMLVGQPPHAGANALEVCASILECGPQSPRARRADVPWRIDHLIRRCMARKPEDRFVSVEEFACALARHSGSSADHHAWIVSDEWPRARSLPAVDGALTQSESSRQVGSTAAELGPTRSRRPCPHRFRPSLALLVVLSGGLLWSGASGLRRDQLASSFVQKLDAEPIASAPPGSLAPLPAQSVSSTPVSKPMLEPRDTPTAVTNSESVGTSKARNLKSAYPARQTRTSLTVHSAAGLSGKPPDPVLQYGRF